MIFGYVNLRSRVAGVRLCGNWEMAECCAGVLTPEGTKVSGNETVPCGSPMLGTTKLGSLGGVLAARSISSNFRSVSASFVRSSLMSSSFRSACRS